MMPPHRAWLITPQAPAEIWSGYGNIASDDLIIAVDGGLKRCLELNLSPHYLCGDLDSVDPSIYESFPQDRIWLFERDKNETDTELAVLKSMELGIKNITICNDMSGRQDHAQGLIQNMLLAHLHKVACDIDSGTQRLLFMPGIWEIKDLMGSLLSLIAWQQNARIATSDGLRWSLDELRLKAELSRGISNEIIADNALIRVVSGLVLAILTKRG
jgi:thiamine pyrophosphokinase